MKQAVFVYPENNYVIAQHMRYGKYVTFVNTDPQDAANAAAIHAQKMFSLEKN